MPNIWKAQSKVNNKIKRNNHDLSKKSNISLKFGTLYPVYCKKVYPGDSFSIDTAFNLKLQPVIFPVQTKMRAHMHFFYVRNKNLWTGWEDWVTGLRTNEETPHPYLSVRDEDIKTSSIHDFLGVPTTLVSSGDTPISSNFVVQSLARPRLEAFYRTPNSLEHYDSQTYGQLYEAGVFGISSGDRVPVPLLGLNFSSPLSDGHIQILDSNVLSFLSSIISNSLSPSVDIFYSNFNDVQLHDADKFVFYSSDLSTWSLENNVLVLGQDLVDKINSLLETYRTVRVFLGSLQYQVPFEYASYPDHGFIYLFSSSDLVDYSDLHIPLYSRELRLNALPYRAYESIYNAFYRNTQVDPLIINGRTEYNKFVENMGDGADNFNYHLHQRNYELDFLTSALPSPQQGVAPLVGMTALGDITIEDENGITTAKATVADDGTITDVVVTSPAASIEHQRVAMSLAQFGMNIQDFRNANAYLRLLETSIRKGYRYIENILGHWGVAPKHNVLDMPEFIGGFSRDVQVSTVVSSADTLGSDGLSLGDYGGYAQLVGGSKSPVRHFCDDHGFIIGILSVVPTPCYSQLLPKQMIAPTSFLDYYFPEFDQIGYQPITYKEVAPIQSYLDSLIDPNKRLEDTFGYQRPNYDLVGDVDEVHGLFRTDFRNYVINRIFDTRPELGHDFISINPSEINQIFVNTNPDDDCIIGEIGFAVHTKRPVSRVVIPGLGH